MNKNLRKIKRGLKYNIFKYTFYFYKYKILEFFLKKKNKIKILFPLYSVSIWKTESLYKKMLVDNDIEPLLLVCNWKKEEFEELKDYLKEKKYNYILNTDNLNIEKEIKPDIILYSCPYMEILGNNINIRNLKTTLTCYIPYYYNIDSNYESGYNQPFHNFLWRYYVPTDIHLEHSKKFSKMRGKNVRVLQYLQFEKFFEMSKKYENKIKKKKILIWAPHHILDDSNIYKTLTFEKYSDFMIEMSEKYKDDLKIIFKPHPILYYNLIKKWGKERTEKYYNLWKNSTIRGIHLKNYEELFFFSDGMIHNCGSFTIEYLYLKKPVCRITNDIEKWKEEFNEIGLEALQCHQIAKNKQDIENFIQDLLKNKDDKKIEKEKFYENYLKIDQKDLPSDKIIREIKKEFNIKDTNI